MNLFNAKPNRQVFELPFGVLHDGAWRTKAEIRELSGADEDILASQGDVFMRFNRLISGCLLSVDGVPGHVLADHLTAVDRLFILIAIRRVTLGDDWQFESTCPVCKHRERWKFNLSKIETKIPEQRSMVFEGESFGFAFRGEIQTGKTEAWERDAIKKFPGCDVSIMLLSRLTSFAGVPIEHDLRGAAKRFKEILDSFVEVPHRIRRDIQKQIDEAEGGIDLSIDLVCGDGESLDEKTPCKHEWKSAVPLGSADFFRRSET